MNALYPTSDLSYLGILLVFFRLLGLFLLVPGFSHGAIPMVIKLLTALSISLVLHPIVAPYLVLQDGDLGGYIVAVLRETAVGLMMGFVAYVTFEAISLGAQFLGYQMGLGTVGMMDPEHNAQLSTMVPFHTWIALVIFFIADMHHNVFHIFTESFRVTQSVDIQSMGNPALLKFFMGITAKLFALAIQLAAPITLLVLSSNMVIGMLARMMPQMNILLFSFPITITLGFVGLYIISPDLLDSLELIMGEMSGEIMALVRIL